MTAAKTAAEVAADFDGDGVADLAIGHRGGLREDPDQLWTQGTRGIKGAVGDDTFGAAIASGTPGA